jgi:predicted peptidase
MGGYGSWELATRMPDRFAAVVPICGGGDEHWADHLVNVPIWAWHGDADPAVPVERSRKMIEAIKQSGGHPKYTELKGVGHNSWTPAYSDPEGPIPWMFEHVKS